MIVDGNSLREGTYFNESRIRRLGLFSKSIFSDKLASFEGASTYEEVRKSLESYL